MKRTGLLLAIAAGLSLQAMADNSSRVLFTHTVAGDIQPRFISNVDSITFSRIDSEGFEHEKIVSQKIWMTDTVVTIDLADINHAGFLPPETRYTPGTIVLDESPMWGSIIDAGPEFISLDKSFPAASLPRPGDRLVTVKTEGLFPAGFAGEVVSVTSGSDAIVIACKSINPLTAIESYFCVGSTPDPEEETQPMASTLANNWNHNDAPFDLGFGVVDFDFTQYHYKSGWDEDFRKAGMKGEQKGSFSVGIKGVTHVAAMFNNRNLLIDGIFDVEYSFNLDFSYSGGLIAETDFSNIPFIKNLEGNKPIPQVPFLEFYWKVRPKVSFEGQLAAELHCEKVVGAQYHITYNSNKNIKSIFAHPVYREISDECELQVMGEIELKAGVEGEIAIRNLGYIDTDEAEFGAKAYIEVEGGGKLSASYMFPSQPDFSTGTDFYTQSMKKNDFTVGLYAQARLGAKGVARFKDKKNDDEFGGEVKAAWNTPEFFKPIASWDFYPEFENVNFIGATRDNPQGLFAANISNNLLLPVKVGYRIMDEYENVIGTSYYENTYRKPEDFMNYEIRVEDMSKMVNRKCLVYPIFKFVGWEILATPAKEVNLTVKPVTGQAKGIQSSAATLTGSVDGAVYIREPAFAGIKLSESPNINADTPGKKLQLDEDGNMQATFDGLEKNTRYYYAAYTYVNGQYRFGTTLSFLTPDEEWVDLGLSVYWASANVGGKKPSDTGNYYAWGEIAPKYSYSWDNYFDNPYDATFNWAGCKKVTYDICGNKAYDPAVTVMKEKWRMPTAAEMKELLDNCDWQWSALDGVSGFKVVSRINGNSIFLPATGNFDGDSVSNFGSYGAYWIGTVRTGSDFSTASNLYFVKSVKSTQWGNRYLGRTIRAVAPKQ